MKEEEVKNWSDTELGYQISLLLNYSASSQWCEGICQSLDKCAEIEKIVIEKVWFDGYGKYLKKAANFKRTNINAGIGFGATVDARTRAIACFIALTEGKV